MAAFEISRDKIALAKKNACDLEGEFEVFWKNEPYQFVAEPDPENPDHEIHKFRLRERLPARFTTITVGAIQGLRSALDNAGHELARAAGKINPRHTAFPFAGSAAEFDNGMKGRCRDIHGAFHDVFRAYKPYKGGNDLLWALNEVSNTDKHSILRVGLGSNLGDVLMTSGGLVYLELEPPWNSEKQEIEIGTFVKASNVQYQMNIAGFIAFNEIAVVGGEPVIAVLNHFSDMVEHILGTLEAEARRIGIFV